MRIMIIALLLMLASCGSKTQNASTTQAVADTETPTYLEGYWYNNDSNNIRVFYEVLDVGYIRVYKADMTAKKKYKVEGHYSIVNGVMTIDPMVDSCAKGKQVLTYSLYNQQTIYLNNVEYVDTTTPPEQWYFYSFDNECF